ncbi:hypothetical protein [Neobacillus ginsengisoli]|uniref:Type II toxin-antitoxin system RelE/ParE family toxin n=1 Tax=Neobacillus ginsengisoli TaxID=904295 RepID=A0ABT9Y0N2_9BACI|nr:hypothetical protein [Neobacillus ginsengisoli]MDQ0201193.1 hypothetical protein [Neobacillus ginsengisoli]
MKKEYSVTWTQIALEELNNLLAYTFEVKFGIRLIGYRMHLL